MLPGFDEQVDSMNHALMDGFSTPITIHHSSGDVISKGIFDKTPGQFSRAGSDFSPGVSVLEILLDDADGIEKGTKLTVQSVLYAVSSPPQEEDGIVILQLKPARSRSDDPKPDFRY